MNTKITLGALTACAALALACSSGGSVTPAAPAPAGSGPAAAPVVEDTAGAPAGPLAVPLGQGLDVSTDGLAATYTLSKAERRSSGQYGEKPENGVWLVAFLRVDVAQGETYACGCDVTLIQADGKVREGTYASFPSRPAFEAASLTAGQHADGWVVFDVPKAALKGARAQLKISALFADTAYGYWTLG